MEILIKTPRITVAIPVFDGERFIGDAIESVLSQTVGDLELVVCDNASSDSTEAICRNYAASDSRVKYVRQPENVGAAMNYRRALDLATAPFFKWLAFDDYMDPQFLEECLTGFETAPESVLVTASMPYVDAKRRPLPFDETRDVYVEPGGDGHVLVDPIEAIASIDPAERFGAVLLGVVHNLAAECFYSVIRSDVLRSVRPHGLYIGADKVLVSELSLRGPFLHLGRALMYRRFHDKNIGSQSLAEYSKLVAEPSTTRAIRVSQTIGYAGAIWTAPASAGVKLRCVPFLLHKITRTAFSKSR